MGEMRLICPNCEAQYEVDPSQIPAAGRDVQCSNCDYAWFQGPARPDWETGGSGLAAERPPDRPDIAIVATDERTDTESPTGDEMFDDSSPLPRRQLDARVAEILREEAERETAARRWEGTSSGFLPDRKPELAQTGAEPPQLRRDARSGGETPPSAPVPDIGDIDVLPDLRKKAKSTGKAIDRRRTARRRGFRMGFVLVVFAVAFGTALQAFAPQISARFPQAGPHLAVYVEWAGRMRELLDGAKVFLLARLGEMIEMVSRLTA